MNAPHEEVTEDAVMGGRLVLVQPARGHRAGTDAVLLAASVRAEPGDRVADFGAGVGSAGLLLAARRPGLDLTMVEIDPDLAALAEANARRNAIAAKVMAADLADAALPAGEFDHVIMNPPFHPAASRPSPDARTARARTSGEGLASRWLAVARRVLRPGGVVTMIHRPDALAEILQGLEKGFGSLVLVPVHGVPHAPATRLLVAAVKQAKGPLVIERPLILGDDGGRFTAESLDIHGGAALQRAFPLPRRLRPSRSAQR